MDKMYYGMAALEVSEGNIDPSLMVKAMSIADGEEKKGRAAYIELRAKELESEHRKTKVVSAVITTAAVAVAASTIAAKAITSDKAISAGKEAGKILLWLCLGFIGLLLIILFFENQAAKVANNYLDQQSKSTNSNTYQECGTGRVFNFTTRVCEMATQSFTPSEATISTPHDTPSKNSTPTFTGPANATYDNEAAKQRFLEDTPEL